MFYCHATEKSHTAANKHVFCPWICCLPGAPGESLLPAECRFPRTQTWAQRDKANNFIGPGFMRETLRLIKKQWKCQSWAEAINSARRNDVAGGAGRRKQVYTLLINSSSTAVGIEGSRGGAGEREFAMWRGIFPKKKARRTSKRDGGGLLITFELKLQRAVRCDQSGGFPGAAAPSREDARL